MLVVEVRAALFALALIACNSSDDAGATSKTRRCELLRDHMVDMRLGSVDAKDLEKHRKVLQRAFGDKFIASCTTTMSDDDITCALGSTDVTAAAACTRSNAKH